MKFFRFQNSQGIGPFWTAIPEIEELSDLWHDTCQNYSRHPTPFSDSLLKDNFLKHTGKQLLSSEFKEFIFGFASIMQFRVWFPNNVLLTKYKAIGFNLHVFDLLEEKVIIGHSQCMAPKSCLKNSEIIF